MMLRLLRGILLCVSCTAVTISAHDVYAQQSEQVAKDKALAEYKQGTIQYNLGNWEPAVKHFKKAFETYPDAAFLFNIAQSYRQASDCKQSSFFYKRYLAIKPDAVNRQEVEGFIRDMEEACKKQQVNSEKPPTSPMTPETTAKPGQSTAPAPPIDTKPVDTKPAPSPSDDPTSEIGEITSTSPSEEPAQDAISDPLRMNEDPDAQAPVQPQPAAATFATSSQTTQPGLLVANAAVGPAFIGLGDVDVATTAGIALGVAYPIALGDSLTIDVGALVSYNPVEWNTVGPNGEDSHRAGLTGLLANAGVNIALPYSFTARGDLGVGMLLFSGLDDAGGNTLIEQGFMATGTLSTVHLRGALSLEYSVADSLAVRVTPIALGLAPAHDGLRKDIDGITTVQVLLGVTYKI